MREYLPPNPRAVKLLKIVKHTFRRIELIFQVLISKKCQNCQIKETFWAYNLSSMWNTQCWHLIIITWSINTNLLLLSVMHYLRHFSVYFTYFQEHNTDAFRNKTYSKAIRFRFSIQYKKIQCSLLLAFFSWVHVVARCIMRRLGKHCHVPVISLLIQVFM